MVIANEMRFHDVDVTAFGYEMGQMAQQPAAFPCDEKLIALAQACIAEQGKHQTKVGLICTGDQFMCKPDAIAKARADFPQMLAVEMEGAAIGQVCHMFKVPYLVVRAMSDIAGKEQVESLRCLHRGGGSTLRRSDHRAARQAVIDALLGCSDDRPRLHDGGHHGGAALLEAPAALARTLTRRSRASAHPPRPEGLSPRRHATPAEPGRAPCPAGGLGALRCRSLGGAQSSLSEPLFDLLFLLLMLESRPCGNSPGEPRPRRPRRRWSWRGCRSPPGSSGDRQALGDGVEQGGERDLRTAPRGSVGRPLLGFALAGVQGALLVRLAQLTHLAWNPKQSAFVHFGRPAAALYQGFCAPPSCCWHSPVPDPGARAGQQSAPALHWPHPAMGVLLALLAGPRAADSAAPLLSGPAGALSSI